MTLTAEQKTIEAAGQSILGRPRRITGKIASLPNEKGVHQLVVDFQAAKFGAVVNDFQFIPGMIYTSVRAISARINQNYDAWPSEELAKSYQTFLGKPIFVNHANFDPDRARGRVVASRYVEKAADKYIETIMETDASRYRKLGHELRTGGLDSVSMGVEAGFTVCSYCNNKATDVFDMCDHVKFHKGSHLLDPITKEPKLVYEKCYKLGFFELSYVFDPADETAVVNKVVLAGKKQAWGEARAPEDIDTLRLDDKDSAEDYDFVEPYEGKDEVDPNIPFANEIPTIPELRTPDFDQTRRLDRAQEDQGLDSGRRVEDVEDVGAPEDQEELVSQRPQAARNSRRKKMGRTKYAAAEEDEGRPPWLNNRDEDESGDQDRGDDRDDDRDDEDESDDDRDERDDDSDGDDDSDERDDDRDEDEDSQPAPPAVTARKRRAPARRSTRRRTAEDDSDKDDDSDSDDDDDDKDSDDDKPPWLKEKESTRRRRPVNSRSSAQKKRKGTSKGVPMGAPALSERGKTATRTRRQHFADDSGNTDGGPYGENNLGEQAEVYIPTVYGDEADGVPSEEPVAAPTGDGSKAPNSESNLVARRKKLQARIDAQSAALKRDIAAYQRLAEGVEDPTTVNPELSGTGDQELKGDDFQDVGLSDTETQPNDGDRSAARNDNSRRWFAEFNNWVKQVTGGKTWKHLSSGQLTRAASQWSKGTGVPLDAMFPTLESALRQAKKAEDASRRAAMNRTADESLDVAAPDERTDVERPVSGETDERAQASQFDLGEFGHNADDQDADPDMSVDSQIWAPGEGPGTTASRELMADGMSATRCAEAYIACRIVQPHQKWKVASWLQASVHQSTVEDRTKLMEAIYAANRQLFDPPARRHAAGSMRGPVPPGFGSGGGRTMTAQQRFASELDDPTNDSMMWLG